MKRAMSTQNVKRPEEYGPNGFRGSDDISSSTHGKRERMKRRPNRKTSAVETSSRSEMEGQKSPQRRHHTSDGYDNPKPISRKRQEPRRDLLALLRDGKTVTQKDLMDKENRRVLHFLVLEHKLGLSQKDLFHSIREDRGH